MGVVERARVGAGARLARRGVADRPAACFENGERTPHVGGGDEHVHVVHRAHADVAVVREGERRSFQDESPDVGIGEPPESVRQPRDEDLVREPRRTVRALQLRQVVLGEPGREQVPVDEREETKRRGVGVFGCVRLAPAQPRGHCFVSREEPRAQEQHLIGRRPAPAFNGRPFRGLAHAHDDTRPRRRRQAQAETSDTIPRSMPAEQAPAMTARYRINSPPVIHQTLDGEVIVVNLDTGTYYSLVGTGAAIWDAVERGASVGRPSRRRSSGTTRRGLSWSRR